MPAVSTEIKLLSMTPNPGQLLEDIASISYRTQRLAEERHLDLIRFASGRTVPLDELHLGRTPSVGEILPGYRKDDMRVAEIIPATWRRTVRFIIAIGHHALLRNMNATFLFQHITRKAALHILRYQFSHFNFQSQKYQPQDGFNYLLPSREEVPPDRYEATVRRIEHYMNAAQAAYEDLRMLEADSEWSRCPYPNNVAQTITMTTNFEQWRHIFDCLCDDDYVTEDRDIMMECLLQLKERAPEFFEDYVVSENGRSAKRKASKYKRNVKVNWSMPPQQKRDLGLYVPDEIPGEETEIP